MLARNHQASVSAVSGNMPAAMAVVEAGEAGVAGEAGAVKKSGTGGGVVPSRTPSSGIGRGSGGDFLRQLLRKQGRERERRLLPGGNGRRSARWGAGARGPRVSFR
jgi:hypothetical protein